MELLKPMRAQHRMSNACDMWTAHLLHELLLDYGLRCAADTLKQNDVDNGLFMRIEKDRYVRAPYNCARDGAEKLHCVKRVLATL